MLKKDPRYVRGLKPIGKVYRRRLGDPSGLYVLVSAKGSKSYQLRYVTPAGRRRWYTVCRFGDLALDEVRRKARRLLIDLRDGVDPAGRKKQQQTPTVTDLAEELLLYLGASADEIERQLERPTRRGGFKLRKKRPPKPRTLKDYFSQLKNDIEPALGSRLVTDVTAQDIDRFHSLRSAHPYAANRKLSLLNQMFALAVNLGYRTSNPAAAVSKFPENRRAAGAGVYLTDSKLRAFWHALDDLEGTHYYAARAIKTMTLTGWRKTEVLRLRWDALNFETGEARLGATKRRENEYRSLPEAAAEVIRQTTRVVGCPFVFPGQDRRSHLKDVRRCWIKLLEATGLDDLGDDLGPLRRHDLRHNRVVRDLSRGASMKQAGAVVGHRSVLSTEVYADVVRKVVRRIADEGADAMMDVINAEK